MSEDIGSNIHPVTIPFAVLERAKTALEHRINEVETDGIPHAEFRRNAGLAEVLKMSLEHDKMALAAINKAIDIA